MVAELAYTLHHLGDRTDMFAYIMGGGPVMLPLLVLSAIMWMLVFERVVFFHRLEFKDISAGELLHWYRSDTIQRCSKYGLRSQLGCFLQERKQDDNLTASVLEQYHLRTAPTIDRSLDVINTMALACPLLGLLGTVSGMITTFDVIALFGTGNSRALAGGISEALITTQGGLLVSIPGLFASAVLNLRARRLRERLEVSIMNLKRIVKA